MLWFWFLCVLLPVVSTQSNSTSGDIITTFAPTITTGLTDSLNVTINITINGTTKCSLCGYTNYICSNTSQGAYNLSFEDPRIEGFDIQDVRLEYAQVMWCSSSLLSISLQDVQVILISSNSAVGSECTCNSSGTCTPFTTATIDDSGTQFTQVNTMPVGSLTQLLVNTSGYACLAALDVVFVMQRKISTTGTLETPATPLSTSYLLYGVIAAAVLVILITVIAVVIILKKRKVTKVMDTQLSNYGSTIRLNEFQSEYNVVSIHANSGYNAEPFSNYAVVSRDILEAYGEVHSQSAIGISGMSEPRWKIKFAELTFERELGRGAFGVVQQGTWRSATVAIKMMLATKNLGMEEYHNFLQEAQLLSALRPHSNIIQFQGACIDEGHPLCIVTEFMPLGNLFDYIRANPLPFDQLLTIIRGIAAGMQHLQSENIVHRDLAARNVLLGRNLNPKISDFGMSRLTEEETNTTTSEIGPVKWMSPELLMDRQYSAKSDAWSFGILLIELMTKNLPYPDYNPTQVATQVTSRMLIPALPIGVEPIIKDVFDRCVQYNVEERAEFNEICKLLSE